MDAFGLFRGIAKSFAAFPDYLARTNGEYQLWKAYGTNWKEVERQRENKASMAIEEHQSKMKNDEIVREGNKQNARAQVLENMDKEAQMSGALSAYYKSIHPEAQSTPEMPVSRERLFSPEGQPYKEIEDPLTGGLSSPTKILGDAKEAITKRELSTEGQKRQDLLDKEKAKIVAKDLESERSIAAQEDRQAATRSDIRLRHEMDKKIKKYEFDLDEKDRLRKMEVVEYPVGGRDPTKGMPQGEKNARMISTMVEIVLEDPEKWGYAPGSTRGSLSRLKVQDYPIELMDIAKAKLKVKTPRDKLMDETDEQAIAAVRIQQLILKGIDRGQWDPRDIKWANELAK